MIFHSDQGSEYTGHRFRTACTRMNITQSMGRPGSALDNGRDRVLALHAGVRAASVEQFTTKAAARARVASWVDEYNRDRRHSGLQMRSPIAYELATRAPGPEEAA